MNPDEQRHHSQSFAYLRATDDGEAVYQCPKCQTSVKSQILTFKDLDYTVNLPPEATLGEFLAKTQPTYQTTALQDFLTRNRNRPLEKN